MIISNFWFWSRFAISVTRGDENRRADESTNKRKMEIMWRADKGRAMNAELNEALETSKGEGELLIQEMVWRPP